MTILTISRPSNKCCEYHIWTDAVSCDDMYVTLRNGDKFYKGLSSKVALLSALDAPTDYSAIRDFFNALANDFCQENGFRLAENGYIYIGCKDDFDNLKLDTRL